MTVTLDIPASLAGRVEADARTQNRAVADLLLDAFTDRWGSEDEEAAANLPADIYQTHPLPPLLREPLADALRAGFADSDAGRVTDGETALDELRRYVSNLSQVGSVERE